MAAFGHLGSVTAQTEDGKYGRFGCVTPNSRARLGAVLNTNYRNREVAKASPYTAHAVDKADLPALEKNMVPQFGRAAMLRANERSLADFGGVSNAGGMEQFRYNRPTVERPAKAMRIFSNARFRAPTQHQSNIRNQLMGSSRGFS